MGGRVFWGRGFLRPGLADGIRQRVSVSVVGSRHGRCGGKVKYSYVGTAILVALILGHTFPVIHFFDRGSYRNLGSGGFGIFRIAGPILRFLSAGDLF